MKETENILLRFGEGHPAAEPVDYIKLLYQNEFGCGHLCPGEAQVLASLTREWSDLDAAGGVSPFDSIGNGLCRLNLGVLSKDDLPLAARLFRLSAKKPRGSENSFQDKLSLLTQAAVSGKLPLDGGQTAHAVKDYLSGGIRPVRHSESYRKRYAPHYRVVESHFAVFFPALRDAEKLLKSGKQEILAIDGRCASGKTTLAKLLSALFPCNVFHMDDFFLPFGMRTAYRLSAPGGNVHYERFYNEVLVQIASGKAFCYRPFCCKDGSFGPPVKTAPRPLSVVEGAYSMHPALRKRYGQSVFLTVSPQIQQSRILARNGAQTLKSFKERWIPLEERYFSALQIPSLCGRIIDTSCFT